MKIFRGKTIAIILMIISSNIALAQHTKSVSFDESIWDIKADKFEFLTYKGKQALYLEKGAALLKDSNFKNGIIDYDVSFNEGRKFAKILFRVKDVENYEEFYLRAHQSGNPDAMQYSPVFDGVSGWQLYHGKGYSNAYHFNFKEWMHIRLIIFDGKMNVFINDMSQPILHVHDLKRELAAGQLGFYSLLGGAYYANFRFQEIDEPKLVSSSRIIPKLKKEVLTKWQVSNVFNKLNLKDVSNLRKLKHYKNTKWFPISTEYDGKINLAKFTTKTQENNTVFVKTVITSKKKQIKQLSFGYSDEVLVYVNNKPVYTGQNKFRSRDYRYLGTIGYFDTIHLELKKGENEIIFAVSENFGGWGLKAKLEDLINIR